MKRRIVAGALLAFALWPALHRGLVASFDINPWKLGAWAMYSAPRFSVGLGVYAREGEELVRLEEDRFGETFRESARRFRGARRNLGRFVLPDELADRVLAAHRVLAAIVIVVQSRSIDHVDAMLVVDHERYVYVRDRLGNVQRRG